MSTSDKWDERVGACACGKGEIRRYVDSPDNGWSRTTTWCELHCSKCQNKWSLSNDGKTLTELSTQQAYLAAAGVEHAAEYARHDYVVALLDAYFAKHGLKTKKAEHAFVSELGLFDGNYAAFLKRRQNGSLGRVVNLHNAPDFEKSLLANVDSAVVQQLNEAIAEAHERTLKARAEIKIFAVVE